MFRSVVQNTKVQTIVKSSPFEEDTAAHLKFGKTSLLQVLSHVIEIVINVFKF